MAQYSVRLENRAGCLDRLVESLDRAQVRSFACACTADATTTVFSVDEESSDMEGLQSVGAERDETPVIHLRVANRAGCLSEALLPLSRAGVRFQSVTCACAAGELAGTVTVGIAGS